MSQAEQPEPEDDQKVEKDITVIAYPRESNQHNLREWLAQVTDCPVDEYETTENTREKIVYDFGREEKEVNVSTLSYKEEIFNQIEGQTFESGEAEIRVERETLRNRTAKIGKSSAARRFRNELLEGLSNEYLNGAYEQVHTNRWQHVDDPDLQLKVYGDGVEEQRVLAKEKDREGDDLYETMAEVPCLRLKVKMQADSEEAINELSEEFISELTRELSSNSYIGRVRYAECTVTTVREGDCYDI